ncbi:MAG: class I SAM-dependent rRNA methyltransferase [Legionella sp.]
MKPLVYLDKTKQTTIINGHPWVFPKAILKHTGKLITGKLVDVLSEQGEYIGSGVYNEHSLYRVRMLAYAHEPIDVTSLQSIIIHRLQQAITLRQMINLPNRQTSAYRLVNSEGDGLSGLTVDRFNQICIVSSTAYWLEENKSIIKACIQQLLPHDMVFWISQEKALAQDGWSKVVNEELSGIVQIFEAGVKFEIDFSHRQKTGLFLDQRENHQRIAQLATGKRVLDLYTYTGGFALHAAKGGAKMVTAVDSSPQAITMARHNANLNKFDDIKFIAADARDYLSHVADYDLVILDPPKLVPSRRHLQQAKNYYRYLHRETFKHMQSGTLLLTCNCSSALSSESFMELVYLQGLAVGKTIRILGSYGPSACHPTLPIFPEGHYLTAVLLQVI